MPHPISTLAMNTDLADISITIVGGFLAVVLSVVGWLIRKTIADFAGKVQAIADDSSRRFDKMAQEVSELRRDINKMMTAQAVDQERHTTTTGQLIEMHRQQSKMQESIIDLVDRVVRLEENQAVKKTVKRRVT